jgi:hypothetical protein
MPSPLHPRLQSLLQWPLEAALRKLKYGFFGMPACHPAPEDTQPPPTHTGTHTHHRHTHTQGHTHTPRVQVHRLLRIKNAQENESEVPEIEAQGGEWLLASPTEACP